MHGSLAPKVRVVIVTLDNHLSGAAERAAAQLAREGSGISITFHAAADWDRNPASLARCHDDIATGDIIIATMLFLEDHIKAVMPALTARRDDCDAMLGIMSASDVVKLTRLGDYRMDKPASGPMALLKKLRGSSKPGQSGGAGQMKMLRRLPKILRFIPGAAQDVRAYFLTLQYWLAGSDDNVVNMVRALVDRYADGERRDLRGSMKAAQPIEYPELGVYHPTLPERMTDNAARLARLPKQGTVGLLMLRSYILGRDSAHYDGVIAALEMRGLNVIPAFASGLDSRPAIEAFFMKDGVATVDAVVSLTGFSLVGGPAYNDAKAAEDMLAALDVPYIAAQPLEFQTLEQWGAGRSGLLPLEATMMVAIPELDGAILPSVFGGRSDGSGDACTGCLRACTFPTGGLVREMQACPERADALAAKVAKLVTLRRSDRSARKVAMVLFNFPPNAGATGTAAYMAVFDSVFATLVRLSAEGYTVDLPASVDALRDTLLKVTPNASVPTRTSTPASPPTIMSVASRTCAKSKRNGALPPARRKPTAATSMCSAHSSAMSLSACSPGSVTKAIRCGCCSKGPSPRRMRSVLSIVTCAKISRRTPCCISARTARSNSCPASRPALVPNAGPSG
jgi:magnesium chelatase subunit H